MQYSLLLVLVHELLISSSGLRRRSAQCAIVLKLKSQLKSGLEAFLSEKHHTSLEEFISSGEKEEIVLPRYIRVNPLRTCMDDVVGGLRSEGYVIHEKEEGTFDGTFADSMEIFMDAHVPHLLVSSRGSTQPASKEHSQIIPFTDDNPRVQSGELVLQDKASCMPVVVLDPGIHS
jgi:25S rRNA (cytosine2278-C5)-methyltransferase